MILLPDRKPTLLRTDGFHRKGSKFINYNLSNSFIDGIAQINRPVYPLIVSRNFLGIIVIKVVLRLAGKPDSNIRVLIRVIMISLLLVFAFPPK